MLICLILVRIYELSRFISVSADELSLDSVWIRF